MISVNQQTFFLVPSSITKNDTDFNIFNASGEKIGTTLSGIHKGYYEENARLSIQSQLEVEAEQLEAQLKFEKQFGIQIDNVASLNMTAEQIMDIMQKQWSIPMEVTDEMIGSFL